jgi:hypothetical protein
MRLCGGVQQCGSVHAAVAVRQCAAVRMMVVCGSVRGSVCQYVCTVVCGSAHSSMQQCAQQCAAMRLCGGVQQCGSVHAAVAVRQCVAVCGSAAALWQCGTAVYSVQQCKPQCVAVRVSVCSSASRAVRGSVRSLLTYLQRVRPITVLFNSK